MPSSFRSSLGATDIATGDLILVVDEGDLERLVGLMLQPKAAVVPIAGAPKFPDTRSVTGLRMEVGTSDGVLIEVKGGVASMSGSPASFARLAREFRLFRELSDLKSPACMPTLITEGTNPSDE